MYTFYIGCILSIQQHFVGAGPCGCPVCIACFIWMASIHKQGNHKGLPLHMQIKQFFKKLTIIKDKKSQETIAYQVIRGQVTGDR
jgi:hypothetical protein